MPKAKSIPYFEDADSAPKEGVPVVERDAINAIVWNPAKKEVIVLDWGKFGWHTFIIGGIEKEDNGDPVQAAIREITEETGYESLKLLLNIGQTRSGYYAAHKGENRISNATCLLFELLNEKKSRIPDASNLPHTFKWLPSDQVVAFLTPSSQKYIWEKAKEYLKSAR